MNRWTRPNIIGPLTCRKTSKGADLVGEVPAAAGGDQHVGGFDVALHQPGLVRDIQRVGDLVNDPHHPRGRQRALAGQQPARRPPCTRIPSRPRPCAGSTSGGSGNASATRPSPTGSDWVWSSQPTHDALIHLDTYIAAQDVIKHRTRSRTAPGHNSHPQTKRSYRLRSYLFCDLCGRRMFGKSRRQRPYYACAPKTGQRVPDGHPGSLWIAEDALLDVLNTFLTHHVFGAYRTQLLDATITERANTAATEHAQQITATQTALAVADLDRRRAALVRALELADDLDAELLTDISHRRKELAAERTRLRERLDQLLTAELQRSNPALLDLLPVGPCDLDSLPEDIARRLFEALRLEIHYNKTDHRAQFRITLSSETLATAHQASAVAIAADQQEPAAQGAASDAPPATSGRFPSVGCTQLGIMRTQTCR